MSEAELPAATEHTGPTLSRKPSPPHVLDRTAWQVIQEAKKIIGSGRVCVGFSGGKDSIASMALCREYFPDPDQLSGYFLYTIPGLSFQERYIQYAERRFNLTIHRLPAPMLSTFYRDSVFRHPTTATQHQKRIKTRDVENYMRSTTNSQFIAVGEKTRDSIERCAQIKKHGGIDHNRHRFYPLAYWSDRQVYSYLKIKRVPISTDYHILQSIQQLTTTGKRKRLADHSFAVFNPDHLLVLREKWPGDYEKVLRYFPFLAALVMKRERERAGFLDSGKQDAGQGELEATSGEEKQ